MRSITTLILAVLAAANYSTIARADTATPRSSNLTSNPLIGDAATEYQSRFALHNKIVDNGMKALCNGKNAEAEADARQALALRVSTGQAEVLLAQALDAQGKEADALQEYRAIVDAGDPRREDLLAYTQLLLKASEWPNAVRAYTKAIPQLTPEVAARAKSGSVPDTFLLQQAHDFTVDKPRTIEFPAAAHTALGLLFSEHSDWEGRTQDDKAMEHYKLALLLVPQSEVLKHYYDKETNVLEFRRTHTLNLDVGF